MAEETSWTILGLRLGNIWASFRQYLGIVWAIFGYRLGNIWVTTTSGESLREVIATTNYPLQPLSSAPELCI